MAEPSPSDTVRIKVTPDLGLPDVVVVGLGAMVGAGVFVLTGTVARVAGVAAVLGIGIAAFVVFLNSLAYAELAGARPNAAGGGYGWVRETLPPPTGFVSGWLSWAGHLAAAALSAAGIGLLADYLLDEVLGVPGIPVGIPLGGGTYNVSEKVLAAVVFLAFVAARTRPHARIRRFPWVGALKITLVALFVGVGAVALTRVPDLAAKFGSPLSPGPVAGITLAAGIFFVAFQGFETIAQSADRVKSPHRTVPAGIFIALGIAVVLYLTFYLVALGNVATNTPTCTTAWDCLAQGPRDLREPELGSFFAASSIAGATGWPVLLFLVAAVFAMTTALDSNLGSAARAVFTMARDGSLPKSLGRIGERTHAPGVAQLAGGGVGLLFLLPLSIEGLAATAGILFLTLYTLVYFALSAERRRQRTAARGFRGLQKLARIGERMGVDTRPVVKIGNRVYEIILDTLKEEDVNLLVMGWRGERVEGDRRILGSNIDYLIENAPCDVVVFKTKGLTRPLRRIVVLSSPLWSSRRVDALALILPQMQGATCSRL